jgi:hypothetical protein
MARNLPYLSDWDINMDDSLTDLAGMGLTSSLEFTSEDEETN